MQVKMLTALAGDHFSYAPGDIVDLEDAVAEAWIDAKLAVEAPPQEAAIDRIAELNAYRDALARERDGLAAERDDLKGKLAAALREKQGAIDEMKIHKTAADDLRKQLAEGKTKPPPAPKV
jgi:hypothetical protein